MGYSCCGENTYLAEFKKKTPSTDIKASVASNELFRILRASLKSPNKLAAHRRESCNQLVIAGSRCPNGKDETATALQAR